MSPHEHGHQITLPTIIPREWRKYIDELSEIAYWRTEKLITLYELNVKNDIYDDYTMKNPDIWKVAHAFEHIVVAYLIPTV